MSYQIKFKLDPEDLAWVQTTLAHLTCDEKIGQVLHPILINDWGMFKEDPCVLAERYQLGGSFQALKSMEVLRDFVNSVQPKLKVPLVVSGDYECRVSIQEGTNLGSTMNLAAIQNCDEATDFAYRLAATVAQQGCAVGTRWTFAPVADINYNHQNPITNIRSFGDDPDRIAALVAAFVKGVQDHGMAATLKHFPGDGMDDRDQHVCTSMNTLDYADWKATYGKTFQAGVDAGVLSIMMGHIALKGVSTKNEWGDDLPATLDPALHKFLRDELHFDGLIISDAIGMGGCTPHCKNEGEVVVKNLCAGSDMVLFPRNLEAAVEAIREALATHVLSMERLDDAVGHVLKFKAQLGLHLNRELPSESEAKACLSHPSYVSLGEELAQKSMTCLRQRSAPLHLKSGDEVLILTLPVEKPNPNALKLANEESKKPHGAWEEAFAKYNIKTHFANDVETYRAKHQECQACFHVFPVMPQAGRGSIRLTYPALQIIEQTRQDGPEQKIYVSTGSPYVLDELAYLANFYCLYGSTPNLIRGFVDQLMQGQPFSKFRPLNLNHT